MESVCIPRGQAWLLVLKKFIKTIAEGLERWLKCYEHSVALVENPRSISGTHMGAPVLGDSVLSAALHWVPHMHIVHIYMCVQANTIKMK